MMAHIRRSRSRWPKASFEKKKRKTSRRGKGSGGGGPVGSVLGGEVPEEGLDFSDSKGHRRGNGVSSNHKKKKKEKIKQHNGGGERGRARGEKESVTRYRKGRRKADTFWEKGKTRSRRERTGGSLNEWKISFYGGNKRPIIFADEGGEKESLLSRKKRGGEK